MSREWKPGDVAMVPGVGPGIYADDGQWLTVRGRSRQFVNVRPLVVIDPEDREQVERLGDALADAFAERHPEVYEVAPDLADEDDDAITRQALRSLVGPPKPDEPQGLGAVVRVPSARGPEFGLKLLVRGHATNKPWMGDAIKQDWCDIEGPIEILSAGVQP